MNGAMQALVAAVQRALGPEFRVTYERDLLLPAFRVRVEGPDPEWDYQHLLSPTGVPQLDWIQEMAQYIVRAVELHRTRQLYSRNVGAMHLNTPAPGFRVAPGNEQAIREAVNSQGPGTVIRAFTEPAKAVTTRPQWAEGHRLDKESFDAWVDTWWNDERK